MNTNQYTQKTLEALQAAQQLAVEYQHNALEPAHLLHALAAQENGLIPQLLQKLNVDPGSFAAAVAEKLGVGVPTLRDVVKELMKPGRDLRSDLPAPILRTDVLDMKDLKPGMVLTGTVRNVIDFGVFVDIGVHQDGLVHISQVCSRFIKHPSEVVAVGDIVKVLVLDVDEKKHRISLSMKQVLSLIHI